MTNKKIKPKCFLISTLVLLFSNLVFAHGGGTNSSGCHKNRKNFTFHCHGVTDSSSNYGLSSSNITEPSPKARIELIKNIQTQLNSLGYKVGKEDGVNGNKTKLAIESFQRDKGLTVDGKHTYSLLSRLKMTKRK